MTRMDRLGAVLFAAAVAGTLAFGARSAVAGTRATSAEMMACDPFATLAECRTYCRNQGYFGDCNGFGQCECFRK